VRHGFFASGSAPHTIALSRNCKKLSPMKLSRRAMAALALKAG
jgi:hypothetical protein